MKKAISLFLALLMLGSQFAACSDSTENAETPGDTEKTPETIAETAADTEAVDTTPVETADPELLGDGLEDGVTFDGYTYNIFQQSVLFADFAAEEMTGEPVNDADFERMSVVEDKLDIEINFSDMVAEMRDGHIPLANIIQAGTNDYSIGTLSAYSACSALMDKLLVDLNSVGNLDLSREWWDQYCTAECTFFDKVYFMTGDISIADNRQTFCAYFNKNMADDYQLSGFYEMVENGTWTLDTFRTQAEAVDFNLDFDNDGEHVNDPDDLYGVWIWDDVMMGVVNAAGVKCCEINPQTSELELTLMSERFLDAFDKFAAVAFNTDVTCAYQRAAGSDVAGSFMSRRGLFLLHCVKAASYLRDMEDDFGILPLPKYDEQQERYVSSAASWGLPFYVIPRMNLSTEEYDTIGYITQMLAYESMQLLTPAFYEQTLRSKVSRDEESSKMLDIIFESRSYDFGWYFGIGGYNSAIMNMLRNYETNFASKYQASLSLAEKVLAETNTLLKELAADE